MYPRNILFKSLTLVLILSLVFTPSLGALRQVAPAESTTQVALQDAITSGPGLEESVPNANRATVAALEAFIKSLQQGVFADLEATKAEGIARAIVQERQRNGRFRAQQSRSADQAFAHRMYGKVAGVSRPVWDALAVELRFGWSTPQLVGWGVAAAGLTLLAAAGVLVWAMSPKVPDVPLQADPPPVTKSIRGPNTATWFLRAHDRAAYEAYVAQLERVQDKASLLVVLDVGNHNMDMILPDLPEWGASFTKEKLGELIRLHEQGGDEAVAEDPFGKALADYHAESLKAPEEMVKMVQDDIPRYERVASNPFLKLQAPDTLELLLFFAKHPEVGRYFEQPPLIDLLYGLYEEITLYTAELAFVEGHFEQAREERWEAMKINALALESRDQKLGPEILALAQARAKKGPVKLDVQRGPAHHRLLGYMQALPGFAELGFKERRIVDAQDASPRSDVLGRHYEGVVADASLPLPDEEAGLIDRMHMFDVLANLPANAGATHIVSSEFGQRVVLDLDADQYEALVSFVVAHREKLKLAAQMHKGDLNRFGRLRNLTAILAVGHLTQRGIVTPEDVPNLERRFQVVKTEALAVEYLDATIRSYERDPGQEESDQTKAGLEGDDEPVDADAPAPNFNRARALDIFRYIRSLDYGPFGTLESASAKQMARDIVAERKRNGAFKRRPGKAASLIFSERMYGKTSGIGRDVWDALAMEARFGMTNGQVGLAWSAGALLGVVAVGVAFALLLRSAGEVQAPAGIETPPTAEPPPVVVPTEDAGTATWFLRAHDRAAFGDFVRRLQRVEDKENLAVVLDFGAKDLGRVRFDLPDVADQLTLTNINRLIALYEDGGDEAVVADPLGQVLANDHAEYLKIPEALIVEYARNLEVYKRGLNVPEFLARMPAGYALSLFFAEHPEVRRLYEQPPLGDLLYTLRSGLHQEAAIAAFANSDMPGYAESLWLSIRDDVRAYDLRDRKLAPEIVTFASQPVDGPLKLEVQRGPVHHPIVKYVQASRGFAGLGLKAERIEDPVASSSPVWTVHQRYHAPLLVRPGMVIPSSVTHTLGRNYVFQAVADLATSLGSTHPEADALAKRLALDLSQENYSELMALIQRHNQDMRLVSGMDGNDPMRFNNYLNEVLPLAVGFYLDKGLLSVDEAAEVFPSFEDLSVEKAVAELKAAAVEKAGLEEVYDLKGIRSTQRWVGALAGLLAGVVGVIFGWFMGTEMSQTLAVSVGTAQPGMAIGVGSMGAFISILIGRLLVVPGMPVEAVDQRIRDAAGIEVQGSVYNEIMRMRRSSAIPGNLMHTGGDFWVSATWENFVVDTLQRHQATNASEEVMRFLTITVDMLELNYPGQSAEEIFGMASQVMADAESLAQANELLWGMLHQQLARHLLGIAERWTQHNRSPLPDYRGSVQDVMRGSTMNRYFHYLSDDPVLLYSLRRDLRELWGVAEMFNFESGAVAMQSHLFRRHLQLALGSDDNSEPMRLTREDVEAVHSELTPTELNRLLEIQEVHWQQYEPVGPLSYRIGDEGHQVRFVPTDAMEGARILKRAGFRPGQTLMDLGMGRADAFAGAAALDEEAEETPVASAPVVTTYIGYEMVTQFLNDADDFFARLRTRGVVRQEDATDFRQEDFLEVEWPDVDVIYIYLNNSLMQPIGGYTDRLQEKLIQYAQTHPETKVVIHSGDPDQHWFALTFQRLLETWPNHETLAEQGATVFTTPGLEAGEPSQGMRWTFRVGGGLTVGSAYVFGLLYPMQSALAQNPWTAGALLTAMGLYGAMAGGLIGDVTSEKIAARSAGLEDGLFSGRMRLVAIAAAVLLGFGILVVPGLLRDPEPGDAAPEPPTPPAVKPETAPADPLLPKRVVPPEGDAPKPRTVQGALAPAIDALGNRDLSVIVWDPIDIVNPQSGITGFFQRAHDAGVSKVWISGRGFLAMPQVFRTSLFAQANAAGIRSIGFVDGEPDWVDYPEEIELHYKALTRALSRVRLGNLKVGFGVDIEPWASRSKTFDGDFGPQQTVIEQTILPVLGQFDQDRLDDATLLTQFVPFWASSELDYQGKPLQGVREHPKVKLAAMTYRGSAAGILTVSNAIADRAVGSDVRWAFGVETVSATRAGGANLTFHGRVHDVGTAVRDVVRTLPVQDVGLLAETFVHFGSVQDASEGIDAWLRHKPDMPDESATAGSSVRVRGNTVQLEARKITAQLDGTQGKELSAAAFIRVGGDWYIQPFEDARAVQRVGTDGSIVLTTLENRSPFLGGDTRNRLIMILEHSELKRFVEAYTGVGGATRGTRAAARVAEVMFLIDDRGRTEATLPEDLLGGLEESIGWSIYQSRFRNWRSWGMALGALLGGLIISGLGYGAFAEAPTVAGYLAHLWDYFPWSTGYALAGASAGDRIANGLVRRALAQRQYNVDGIRVDLTAASETDLRNLLLTWIIPIIAEPDNEKALDIYRGAKSQLVPWISPHREIAASPEFPLFDNPNWRAELLLWLNVNVLLPRGLALEDFTPPAELRLPSDLNEVHLVEVQGYELLRSDSGRIIPIIYYQNPPWFFMSDGSAHTTDGMAFVTIHDDVETMARARAEEIMHILDDYRFEEWILSRTFEEILQRFNIRSDSRLEQVLRQAMDEFPEQNVSEELHLLRQLYFLMTVLLEARNDLLEFDHTKAGRDLVTRVGWPSGYAMYWLELAYEDIREQTREDSAAYREAIWNANFTGSMEEGLMYETPELVAQSGTTVASLGGLEEFETKTLVSKSSKLGETLNAWLEGAAGSVGQEIATTLKTATIHRNPFQQGVVHHRLVYADNRFVGYVRYTISPLGVTVSDIKLLPEQDVHAVIDAFGAFFQKRGVPALTVTLNNEQTELVAVFRSHPGFRGDATQNGHVFVLLLSSGVSLRKPAGAVLPGFIGATGLEELRGKTYTPLVEAALQGLLHDWLGMPSDSLQHEIAKTLLNTRSVDDPLQEFRPHRWLLYRDQQLVGYIAYTIRDQRALVQEVRILPSSSDLYADPYADMQAAVDVLANMLQPEGINSMHAQTYDDLNMELADALDRHPKFVTRALAGGQLFTRDLRTGRSGGSDRTSRRHATMVTDQAGLHEDAVGVDAFVSGAQADAFMPSRSVRQRLPGLEEAPLNPGLEDSPLLLSLRQKPNLAWAFVVLGLAGTTAGALALIEALYHVPDSPTDWLERYRRQTTPKPHAQLQLGVWGVWDDAVSLEANRMTVRLFGAQDRDLAVVALVRKEGAWQVQRLKHPRRAGYTQGFAPVNDNGIAVLEAAGNTPAFLSDAIDQRLVLVFEKTSHAVAAVNAFDSFVQQNGDVFASRALAEKASSVFDVDVDGEARSVLPEQIKSFIGLEELAVYPYHPEDQALLRRGVFGEWLADDQGTVRREMAKALSEVELEEDRNPYAYQGMKEHYSLIFNDTQTEPVGYLTYLVQQGGRNIVLRRIVLLPLPEEQAERYAGARLHQILDAFSIELKANGFRSLLVNIHFNDPSTMELEDALTSHNAFGETPIAIRPDKVMGTSFHRKLNEEGASGADDTWPSAPEQMPVPGSVFADAVPDILVGVGAAEVSVGTVEPRRTPFASARFPGLEEVMAVESDAIGRLLVEDWSVTDLADVHVVAVSPSAIAANPALNILNRRSVRFGDVVMVALPEGVEAQDALLMDLYVQAAAQNQGVVVHGFGEGLALQNFVRRATAMGYGQGLLNAQAFRVYLRQLLLNVSSNPTVAISANALVEFEHVLARLSSA